MANGIKALDLGSALPSQKNGGSLEGADQATFKITGSGLTTHTFDTLDLRTASSAHPNCRVITIPLVAVPPSLSLQAPHPA
jgi:hypothetical protein